MKYEYPAWNELRVAWCDGHRLHMSFFGPFGHETFLPYAWIECKKCGMTGRVVGLLPEHVNERLRDHLPMIMPTCSQYMMYQALM